MLDIDIEMRTSAFHLAVRLATANDCLALVGPNGAGKSTTLLCILGIQRPTAGRIVLGDRVLFDAKRGIDIPTEERGFGYVPQQYALFPHLTAQDNVAFALACTTAGRRMSRRQRRQRARAMLHALGVEHVAEQLPATLSGGEAQRVALGRALIMEPAALLLDEPFAALDAHTRPAMRELLQTKLRELGRPALLVTHDIRDVAVISAHLAVIEHGRLVQQGTLAAIARQPATPFTAEFTSSYTVLDADTMAHTKDVQS